MRGDSVLAGMRSLAGGDDGRNGERGWNALLGGAANENSQYEDEVRRKLTVEGISCVACLGVAWTGRLVGG